MAHMGAPPPYSQMSQPDPGVIVSPTLPFTCPLDPLSDGFMITISGRVSPKSNSWFHVNLSLANGLNGKVDTAFHLNPRLDQKQVVRNSFLNRAWGAEEKKGPAFPLQPDQNFEIILLVTDQGYKVAFNGSHFCEFKHRVPKERVSYLIVEGDLIVHQLKLTDPRRPAGYAPPQPAASYVSVNYSPAPQAYPTGQQQAYPTGQQAYPTGQQPYPTGQQPYPTGPQTFPPGQGQYPGFQGPQGYPSAGGMMPGAHAPMQSAGAPLAVHIHHNTGAGKPTKGVVPQHAYPQEPQRNKKKILAVPHEIRLPKGAVAGTVVRIEGRPKDDAKGMVFNFLTANKENVAFHFNPRFEGGRVVVRNTLKKGVWGAEERKQPKFPFREGQDFTAIIYSDPDKFQVTINGENFVNYNHRIRNLERIQFVVVKGDVDLYSLKL